MSLSVVCSDEAKTEFYKAEQWYAEIGLHLAERFVQAVEDTVNLIEESPLRFPVVYRERRRAGVKRFPYGLFFQVEADRILVIACFHGRRNPRRWQRRRTLSVPGAEAGGRGWVWGTAEAVPLNMALAAATWLKGGNGALLAGCSTHDAHMAMGGFGATEHSYLRMMSPNRNVFVPGPTMHVP